MKERKERALEQCIKHRHTMQNKPQRHRQRKIVCCTFFACKMSLMLMAVNILHITMLKKRIFYIVFFARIFFVDFIFYFYEINANAGNMWELLHFLNVSLCIVYNLLHFSLFMRISLMGAKRPHLQIENRTANEKKKNKTFFCSHFWSI